MNIKRIIFWSWFLIVIALIVWGMIAVNKKTNNGFRSLPIPDITSSDWIKGNATSTVTVVEYSDFQCPACAAYFPLVKRIVLENINNIRFVYRHFPLSQHQNALPASYASEAAGKQGKFWEMYDLIFTNHDIWENSTTSREIFTEYAQKLGLDMNKYSIDVDSKEIKDKIDLDMNGGLKAKIDSTPSFYINGNKIQNPQSYEEFKKLIDEAIKKTT